MKFYKGINGGFEEIYDYGLHDYFNLTDNGSVYKLMASIYDDEYVVIYDKASNYNHNDLDRKIKSEFSSEDRIFIGAINRELHISKVDDLNNEVIQTLIEILEEIKNYYLKTKKNVTLKFYGMEHIPDDNYNCDNINELITIFESMKDVKARN